MTAIAALAILVCSIQGPDGIPPSGALALCPAARESARIEREAQAWAEAGRIAAVRAAEVAAEEARALAAARQAQEAQAARTARSQALEAAPRATAAPPPPRPAAAPTSLEAALAASPWPASTWSTVLRVIACESGGNTAAVGPLGHRGLMQVDPRLHGPVPADAVGQLVQAYGVYLKQGWAAWQCY